MRVGWLRVELLIPGSRSLKEKRSPLKSLLAKLSARFNVSVAEVAHQDLHQRASIGVALVAADGGNLYACMNAVKQFIYNNPHCQVLEIREGTAGGSETG